MSITALDATATDNKPVVQIAVGALRDVIAHICGGYETQFALGEAKYHKGTPTLLKKQVADRYSRLRCGMMSVELDMSCWLNSQRLSVTMESAVEILTAFAPRSRVHPRVLATLIRIIALEYKEAMSVTVTREMADISLIVSVTKSPPK